MSVEIIPSHAHCRPIVHSSAFVAENAVILADVSIAADASVWFGAVIRGDVQSIRVAERSNIQDAVVIHASTNGLPVLIGSDVSIGHGAFLHSCSIEDGAFVGIGACVLDGATVKMGGMLGAGSVLTPGKSVGAGELWAGNPARFLRVLSDQEKQGIRLNAQRYVALAKHYMSECPAIYRRSINP